MTDTTDNRALVERLTIWAQSGLHEGVYKKALSDMRLAADALTAMLAEARAEALREIMNWHIEVANHDQSGLEYSSLVGIPISNADELKHSVEAHEYSARHIASLIDTPTPAPAQPSVQEAISLRIMHPDCAPKGIPVLIAGGIAMKTTSGKWFTGMDEPAFERELKWQPKWWAHIPQQNDTATIPSMRCAECTCENGGADCNWIKTPATIQPSVQDAARVLADYLTTTYGSLSYEEASMLPEKQGQEWLAYLCAIEHIETLATEDQT